MGMDVCSLIKYDAELLDCALNELESSRIESVRELSLQSSILHDRGVQEESPHWKDVVRTPYFGNSAGTHDTSISKDSNRPKLPSFDKYLKLSSECAITVGNDAMCIRFTTRMYSYLTNSLLRNAVNNVVFDIASIVKSTAWLITRDESPIILAFDHKHTSYGECVQAGASQEKPVSSPDELYLELPDNSWDCRGYWEITD